LATGFGEIYDTFAFEIGLGLGCGVFGIDFGVGGFLEKAGFALDGTIGGSIFCLLFVLNV
jgi:hypothetical protein